jgi:hypothetical protein
VKVFNSSVENRVEKAWRRFKIARRIELNPLCTSFGQKLGAGKIFRRVRGRMNNSFPKKGKRHGENP